MVLLRAVVLIVRVFWGLRNSKGGTFPEDSESNNQDRKDSLTTFNLALVGVTEL